jgi:hypothetical protein
MAEATFEQLWEYTYKEYLKLRKEFNITLTEEQKQQLKKDVKQ